MVDYYANFDADDILAPQTNIDFNDFNGIMGEHYVKRFGLNTNSKLNIHNFKVEESMQIGTFLVLKVNFPGCKTFEGNKILVYEGTDIQSLLKQNCIDPHFSEEIKIRHPIARFEPNSTGWSNALKFCHLLKSEQLDCPDCPF